MRLNAHRLIEAHFKGGRYLPPTPTKEVAKFRNVLEIRDDALSSPARLRPVRGGFVIYVRKTDSVRRRNFSLAHELGHTFFYTMGNGQPRACTLESRERGVVERLCNIFAAELLMPREKFENIWGQAAERLSLRQLEEVASVFAVALEAVIFRAAELALTTPPGTSVGLISESHRSASGHRRVVAHVSGPDSPLTGLDRLSILPLDGRAKEPREELRAVAVRIGSGSPGSPWSLAVIKYGRHYSAFVVKDTTRSHRAAPQTPEG